jgi:cyanophycinase-like exopeptidase
MAKRTDGRNGHNGNGRRMTRRRRMVPASAATLPRLAGGQPATARGSLVIIGGHEEKEGRALILREVARRAGKGKLVVATLASEEPEEMWRDYERAFTALGVRRLEHLDVSSREALLRDG